MGAKAQVITLRLRAWEYINLLELIETYRHERSTSIETESELGDYFSSNSVELLQEED